MAPYKKYSADAAPVVAAQKSSTSAWMLPTFGALAMLSFVSLAIGLRKRATRATRQVSLVQPVGAEENTLLAELEAPIELSPIE
jgi:hypothetical protein